MESLENQVNLIEIFNYIDSFKKRDNKVSFRYCSDEKCINSARYGVLQNYPIYCNIHKEKYMFDVISKKCIYSGCIVQPTFGYIYNKPEYCKKHAKDNMINVKLQLCTHENCSKKATYRHLEIRLNDKNKLELFINKNIKPIYCRIHRKENMINIYKKIHK